MNYHDALDKVSAEMNLPKEVVDMAYKAAYTFIRDKIQGYSLKQDLSYEDFNSLRPSFNLPSLGKLECSYERYCKIREVYHNINKESNDNKED